VKSAGDPGAPAGDSYRSLTPPPTRHVRVDTPRKMHDE